MRKSIILGQLLVAMAFLITWEISVWQFPAIFDPYLFGQPTKICSAFVSYWNSGLLLKDTVTTLMESLSGLILGMVFGLTAGVVLASLNRVHRIVEPYIIALNSMPRPALAPVFLLWFGLGITSKIMLSFSLVFFVVFFNTVAGFRNINRQYTDSVRVIGASRFQVFRLVALPSIYSWLFAGFKTSVSFSIIGSVVGEFVGASRGLGYRMMIATGIMDTHLAYAILIWLGILGTAGVVTGGLVENRVLRWQQSHR